MLWVNSTNDKSMDDSYDTSASMSYAERTMYKTKF